MSVTNHTLLKTTDLEAGYGDFIAIRDVSLTVNEGEIVSVIGPNGAGKTTLLKAIIGLLRPKKGNIFFGDKKISGFSPGRISKLGVGYVPQGTGTFPQMSVKENIEAGAYVLNDRKIISKRLNSVLQIFPRLRERLDYRAFSLSGGERQMLLLARALMLDPKLVLLDEPSTGLDPKMQSVLYGIIRNLRDSGRTLLLVEQNVHKALEVSNRCYVLEVGKVVQTGKSKEVVASGRVKDAYLGIAQP